MPLALAVENKIVIHQMDVAADYLNSTVDEELYMQIPEELENMISSFVSKAPTQNTNKNILRKFQQLIQELLRGDKVCKLMKSLYGLKQSGRQWNKKSDSELKRIELRQLHAGHCLYIQQQTLVIVAT